MAPCHVGSAVTTWTRRWCRCLTPITWLVTAPLGSCRLQEAHWYPGRRSNPRTRLACCSPRHCWWCAFCARLVPRVVRTAPLESMTPALGRATTARRVSIATTAPCMSAWSARQGKQVAGRTCCHRTAGPAAAHMGPSGPMPRPEYPTPWLGSLIATALALGTACFLIWARLVSRPLAGLATPRASYRCALTRAGRAMLATTAPREAQHRKEVDRAVRVTPVLRAARRTRVRLDSTASVERVLARTVLAASTASTRRAEAARAAMLGSTAILDRLPAGTVLLASTAATWRVPARTALLDSTVANGRVIARTAPPASSATLDRLPALSVQRESIVVQALGFAPTAWLATSVTRAVTIRCSMHVLPASTATPARRVVQRVRLVTTAQAALPHWHVPARRTSTACPWCWWWGFLTVHYLPCCFRHMPMSILHVSHPSPVPAEVRCRCHQHCLRWSPCVY